MNFLDLKSITTGIMRPILRRFNHIPFTAALILFIMFLPLVAQIDFPQNDDWVYYNAVVAFKNGNFTLSPMVAPTFYVQGTMGVLWATVFGFSKLPILTLLVSVLNFLVFFTILTKYFTVKTLDGLIFSLLFFFNPLHIYSGLGFMTENYFLFFTLLAFYYVLGFETVEKKSKFIIVNICILLSFFVRQLGLVTSLAFCLYLLFKKRYRAGFLQLLIFGLTAVYYITLFPRTNEMITKSLQPGHLLDFNYFFSLFYTMLIYITAFAIPLVISMVFQRKFLVTKRRLVLFLALSAGLTYLLAKFFVPQKLAWGEFPYLDNVWERKGFFPRGIEGTKYYFHWIYYFYMYWDILAKVGVSLLLSFVFFVRRKAINFYFIFGVLYMLVMLITEKVFDRYLLVLVPVAILFCLSFLEKITFSVRLVTMITVGIFMFYAYQFSMDFILLNRYIWHRSVQLVSQNKVEPSKILGTNPWKLSYPNQTKNYSYIFMFDTLKTRPEAACCWRAIETYTVDFPLNFFIDSKVYLYERKI